MDRSEKEEHKDSIVFSIVIPIYNVGDYLIACLDSVVSQTYNIIEIILVDDGSTDSSPAICDQYAERDHRICVIHKKNGGLVNARKSGAEIATGDYVCCVDGDDYISVDYIEKMAEVIYETSADIVCCGLIRESKNGSDAIPMRYPIGYYDRQRIETEIFPSLIQDEKAKSFHPNLCSKAIRRELYVPVQMKVDPEITMGEDRACLIPCVYHSNSMYLLDDCLYHYRYNPQSITGNQARRKSTIKKTAAILQSEMDLTKYGFQNQLDRLVVRSLFNSMVSWFSEKRVYHAVKTEIMEELQDPFYAAAVSNAHFKGNTKAKMMEYCMKKKWVFMMLLYQKMKYIKKTART